MSETLLRVSKHCRWCGVQYYAAMPHKKDGFCSPHCKQAHHRAYKKYVTRKTESAARLQTCSVTPSKAKKKGRKHA